MNTDRISWHDHYEEKADAERNTEQEPNERNPMDPETTEKQEHENEPPPIDQAKLDADYRDLLRELASEIREQQNKVADSKEIHAADKKRLESMMNELVRAAEDHENKQQTLPFNDDGTGELWREVPVSVLDIPETACLQLEHAGFKTIGDLADWTDVKERSFTEIDGVGPAKAETLKDALERYYAAHPRAEEAEDAGESDETEEPAEA